VVKTLFIVAGRMAREEMGGSMIVIRKEKPDDIAAMRKFNEKAFGQPA
jgi:hypothetical protein